MGLARWRRTPARRASLSGVLSHFQSFRANSRVDRPIVG